MVARNRAACRVAWPRDRIVATKLFSITRDSRTSMTSTNTAPLVGILMGSKSDWQTMQAAADLLNEFGVPNEAKVASAHRSPELVTEYVRSAEGRGLQVIIAAAGLAAHLP